MSFASLAQTPTARRIRVVAPDDGSPISERRRRWSEYGVSRPGQNGVPGWVVDTHPEFDLAQMTLSTLSDVVKDADALAIDVERTGRAGCYALALAHSRQIPVVLLVSGTDTPLEAADAIGVVRYDPSVVGWMGSTVREVVALVGGRRRTDDANDNAMFDMIL